MDKEIQIDDEVKADLEGKTPVKGDYILGTDGKSIEGADIQPYALVGADDPILHEQMPAWDFQNPPEDGAFFSQRLVHTMMTRNGIGLAANQCGLRYSVFALRTEPFMVIFNPRIVDISEEEIFLDEGCLSYPWLVLKIKRPRHIRVRFQHPNGDTNTQKMTGMTARVFLHEFDHLQGITFEQKTSRYHLQQGMRKRKFLLRKLKNAGGISG